MEIFLLINGDDKNRVIWIQQAFCEFQALLHHAQPLAMPVCVSSVYIVVIVLPISRPRIVWRVYVYAIYFSSIKILKQLKCMIVIRLNKGVPQIAVRGIANGINRF